jgi:ABC-2 type transport system permease protein
MMRKSNNLLKQNLRIAARSNIMLYMIGFTLVTALVLKIFLPSINNMEIRFIVDSSVKTEIGDKLERYGRVEEYDSIEDIKARVERMDDTAAIVKNGEGYEIILEGNEMHAIKELPDMILNVIEKGKIDIPIEYESMGRKESIVKPISAILLIISGIIIGGIVMGLTIVEDKETKTYMALSVSPIKWKEYLLGKSMLCIILAVILSLGSTLILMGANMNYLKLLVGILLSGGFGIIFGYVMGAFSENLMGAVAIMKTLFFILLGIPLAAIFVPKTWHFLFYLFPNYWSYRIFNSLTLESGAWSEVLIFGLIALLINAVLLILIYRPIKKRLKLR